MTRGLGSGKKCQGKSQRNQRKSRGESSVNMSGEKMKQRIGVLGCWNNDIKFKSSYCITNFLKGPSYSKKTFVSLKIFARQRCFFVLLQNSYSRTTFF